MMVPRPLQSSAPVSPGSGQGFHEFRTEVQLLCQLRHPNFISLIGFCDEKQEMILVYEYMSYGTLRDHLYGANNDPLPWKWRLKIYFEAARALHYLHTGAKYAIIHRDVKTTNILLDDKMVAKVSDFGLSKMGSLSMSKALIRKNSAVKGTVGYLDLEYLRTRQLTEKSDVFSFGAVLFEVLCCRRQLNEKLPNEQRWLPHWALSCIRKGTFYDIIDRFLVGAIAPECLRTYGDIAASCLHDEGKERPSMGEVEVTLEVAMQLQESADAAMEAVNPGGAYLYEYNETLLNACAGKVLQPNNRKSRQNTDSWP